VDALELGDRCRARRQQNGVRSDERADPLERVVNTDQPARLERVIVAIDVRREARVPN